MLLPSFLRHETDPDPNPAPVRSRVRRTLRFLGFALLALWVIFFNWFASELDPTFLPHLSWLGVFAVVSLICLVGLILYLWPIVQVMKSPGLSIENRFDRENEARKTLAQIIGGILLIGGLYSSIETLNQQRDSQITDRYTKAVEQLGAMQPAGKDTDPRPNITLRLGGVYALGRIAKDSPRDQEAIIEVLTSYIRDNAQASPEMASSVQQPPPPGMQQPEPQPPTQTNLRADVKAAIAVIGRRDRSGWRFLDRLKTEPDLSNADFHRKNLEDINLSWMKLVGADFSGAKLIVTDFSESTLIGADFTGADIIATDFRGADLRLCPTITQPQIDLSNVDKDTRLPEGRRPPKDQK